MFPNLDVSIYDLHFVRAPRQLEDDCGKTSIRWMRVGMPKLADNLNKCIFYLYALNPKSNNADILNGTGFFVARQSTVLPYTWHVYAVSNRHVVAGQIPASVLRINTKQNTTRLIDFEPTDWVCSTTDDLAMVDVTDKLDFSTDTGLWADDISWVDEINFAQEIHRSAYGIGIGDNTIMLGLFSDHSSSKLNAPVGRFGNVAAMPDENHPVRLTPNDEYVRPSYLNDMRSRSGFSGSPVWVWRTPEDDMNTYKDAQGIYPRLHSTQRSFLALIGVHRGQFPDKVIIDFPEDGTKRKAEIPSSMTVVVPAWEIIKLIDHPTFKVMADERDKRLDRADFSERICTLMRAQETQIRGA